MTIDIRQMSAREYLVGGKLKLESYSFRSCERTTICENDGFLLAFFSRNIYYFVNISV